jgi:hypothetical protein
MSERIKFHLDENISNAVAEGLLWEWMDPMDIVGKKEKGNQKILYPISR